MSRKIKCTHCEVLFDEEDMTYFEGTNLCPDCLNEYTLVCERCGNRVWIEDSADCDINLCEHCFDNCYTTCDSCGHTIDYDDAYYFDDDNEYPYCYACYERRSSSEYIHEYSYKPEPVFFGEGNRFFGIELEVDCGGHIDYNAKLVADIANADERKIYIKHDGSLEDGMEIVSYPNKERKYDWFGSYYGIYPYEMYEDEYLYIDEIIEYAGFFGIAAEDVRMLLDYGYNEFDIEEMLYDPTEMQKCISELRYCEMMC
ncbi:MAG: hypothetical protein ACI4KH_07270 [Oscillospiraceae bacterium]